MCPIMMTRGSSSVFHQHIRPQVTFIYCVFWYCCSRWCGWCGFFSYFCNGWFCCWQPRHWYHVGLRQAESRWRLHGSFAVTAYPHYLHWSVISLDMEQLVAFVKQSCGCRQHSTHCIGLIQNYGRLGSVIQQWWRPTCICRMWKRKHDWKRVSKYVLMWMVSFWLLLPISQKCCGTFVLYTTLLPRWSPMTQSTTQRQRDSSRYPLWKWWMLQTSSLAVEDTPACPPLMMSLVLFAFTIAAILQKFHHPIDEHSKIAVAGTPDTSDYWWICQGPKTFGSCCRDSQDSCWRCPQCWQWESYGLGGRWSYLWNTCYYLGCLCCTTAGSREGLIIQKKM